MIMSAPIRAVRIGPGTKRACGPKADRTRPEEFQQSRLVSRIAANQQDLMPANHWSFPQAQLPSGRKPATIAALAEETTTVQPTRTLALTDIFADSLQIWRVSVIMVGRLGGGDIA